MQPNAENDEKYTFQKCVLFDFSSRGQQPRSFHEALATVAAGGQDVGVQQAREVVIQGLSATTQDLTLDGAAILQRTSVPGWPDLIQLPGGKAELVPRAPGFDLVLHVQCLQQHAREEPLLEDSLVRLVEVRLALPSKVGLDDIIAR